MKLFRAGGPTRKNQFKNFFFEVVSQRRKRRNPPNPYLNILLNTHDLFPKPKNCRQLSRIEHEKHSQFVSQSELRTQKPFELVSQSDSIVTSPSLSESSITSNKSSRLGWRSPLGSRLQLARCSPSYFMATSTPLV